MPETPPLIVSVHVNGWDEVISASNITLPPFLGSMIVFDPSNWLILRSHVVHSFTVTGGGGDEAELGGQQPAAFIAVDLTSP